MHRTVVLLSAAALLGACASSNTSNGTMEPQTVSTTSTTTTSSTSSSSTERREGRRGGMDGARMEQMLFRDITLSADQRARLDSLHARYQAEDERMRQQMGGAPMDRDHMRSMMEQRRAEMRAILTPDQQVVFDRNIADMRSRMQQGGRRGAPPVI